MEVRGASGTLLLEQNACHAFGNLFGVTSALPCQQVVDPYYNPGGIIALELQRDDGTVERLETTDNHPFYVEGAGWTRTDELSPGDRIPSADGGILTVAGVSWTGERAVVFNFGVEGYHTYFVGESGAWVHNCLGGRTGAIPAEVRDILNSQSRANDLLQKGVHFTVDGVEVAVRPTHNGELVFRKVFSNTDDDAFDGAARQLSSAMEWNRMRAKVYDHAKAGAELAAQEGSAKVLEFRNVMRAVEGMGD